MNGVLKKARTEIEQLEDTIRERNRQIAELKQNNTDLKEQLSPLMDKLDKLKREMNTLKSDLSREGDASRQIISELLEKDRAISDLKTRLSEAEEDRDNWKTKAQRAGNVKPGDLVPMDEHVTPAKPLVHPPVLIERRGLFGKVDGFVMINAHIDEVGRVRNASYLEHKLNEDDQADAIINRAMQTIMQWKFTPAVYDDRIKVQVWQAVLVPIQNQ